MKTITLLLLLVSTYVTVALSACTTYNSSSGWWADTCRFVFSPRDNTNGWFWQDFDLCPPGYNASATGVAPLPANFNLQQCADGCGAQASNMGFTPMSVLWWNDTSGSEGLGCSCYPWHLDQPQMAPVEHNDYPNTISDVTCATPAPTPASSEVVRVSFYDSECKQPSAVNVAQLGQCAPTWPDASDYQLFESCGVSGALAKRFFSNDKSCSGTSEAETLPVDSCYKDTDSNMYLVNSCVQTETSRKLLAKRV